MVDSADIFLEYLSNELPAELLNELLEQTKFGLNPIKTKKDVENRIKAYLNQDVNRKKAKLGKGRFASATAGIKNIMKGVKETQKGQHSHSFVKDKRLEARINGLPPEQRKRLLAAYSSASTIFERKKVEKELNRLKAPDQTRIAIRIDPNKKKLQDVLQPQKTKSSPITLQIIENLGTGTIDDEKRFDDVLNAFGKVDIADQNRVDQRINELKLMKAQLKGKTDADSKRWLRKINLKLKEVKTYDVPTNSREDTLLTAARIKNKSLNEDFEKIQGDISPKLYDDSIKQINISKKEKDIQDIKDIRNSALGILRTAKNRRKINSLNAYFLYVKADNAFKDVQKRLQKERIKLGIKVTGPAKSREERIEDLIRLKGRPYTRNLLERESDATIRSMHNAAIKNIKLGKTDTFATWNSLPKNDEEFKPFKKQIRTILGSKRDLDVTLKRKEKSVREKYPLLNDVDVSNQARRETAAEFVPISEHEIEDRFTKAKYGEIRFPTFEDLRELTAITPKEWNKRFKYGDPNVDDTIPSTVHTKYKQEVKKIIKDRQLREKERLQAEEFGKEAEKKAIEELANQEVPEELERSL